MMRDHPILQSAQSLTKSPLNKDTSGVYGEEYSYFLMIVLRGDLA